MGQVSNDIFYPRTESLAHSASPRVLSSIMESSALLPLEVVGAVKKPNLQPKSAHHMVLRSKKVASSAELPISKKSGAPKTKVVQNQLHPKSPLVEIPDSDSDSGKSVVKETRSKRRRSSVKNVKKSLFKTARRTRESDSVAVLSSDELPKESETKSTKRRNDITPVTELNSSNSSLSTAYTIDANSSLSDVPVTPKNKDTFIAYVSPFVTMSRGKENARHEYHQRSMLGVAAAQYFTRILEEQNEQLTALCAKWTAYKLENSAEEVHDMINVAISQTELLRKKKFQPIRDLLELVKSGKTEKPIKALDIHWYFDTMQIQIVNLEKRFENLEQLKSNNWEEIAPPPKKAKANKRISSLRLSVSESLKKKRIPSPTMRVTRSAKSMCSTPNLTNTQPKSILKSEEKIKMTKSLRKSKMVWFEVSPGSSPPFSN